MLNSIFLLGLPAGAEWIIIVVAVLVLFGAKKIPEFMRGVGRGVKEFKDAKEREQKKLNSDFSQYVDKNVKLAVQKFTTKLLSEIKDYEFYFIQKVDENFTRKIGVEKMKKEELKTNLQTKSNF